MGQVYKSAVGHNQLAASCVAIVPQPRSPMRVTTYDEGFNADGGGYEDGRLYTRWLWNVMTKAQYVAMRYTLDFVSSRTSELTIITPNDWGIPQCYNSMATLLHCEYVDGYWRDVTVVHNLEER